MVRALQAAGRFAVGVDVHRGYLAQARVAAAHLPLVMIGHRDRWPIGTSSIGSVSLLDTLEHVADVELTLREVARVTKPGGRLAITVPAKHLFSFLDPGNAKLRFPRFHRCIYTLRHGRARYHERFVDLSDGLRGDLSVERSGHENYDPAALIALLARVGFVPIRRDGANLFWRFFQVPQLLTTGALSAWFDRPLRWDGLAFRRANLFLLAVRSEQ